jgi:hypothetical protein
VLDDGVVRVVREYLQREFAGRIVYDFYDAARSARVFEVQDSLGTIRHFVVVHADFFTTRSEAEVADFVERHCLARVLTDAGPLAVVVTRAGIARDAA